MVTLIGFLFTAMLIWPIIVNSQPGTSFYYFYIDWKADNLDNTIFWTAIVLIIVTLIFGAINEQQKKKETIIKETRRYDDIPK